MNGEAGTMQERIEAFYRQSGGPNNPEIERILNDHLMNGKDHGPKGRRETFEDVVAQVVMGDKTLMQLFAWNQNRKNAKEQNRKNELKLSMSGTSTDSIAQAAELQRVHKTLDKLQQDISRLQDSVAQLAAIVQQQQLK